MPFTPIDYSVALWDNVGPYWLNSNQQKVYIPPASAATMDDPKVRAWAASRGATYANPGGARPSGGLVKGAGTWNSKTGKFDQGLAGGNLMSLGIGAFLAAPAVGALVGGGAVPGSVGVGETASTLGIPSAATITGTGETGMALGKFLSNPATILDLIKTGVKGVGGFLEGRAERGQSRQELLARLISDQQSREDAQRTALANFLSGVYTNNQSRQLSQSRTGLEATQLDPYAPSKALNAANIRRSFAGGLPGGPSSRFTGSFDLSALSPESLGRSSDYFYRNVAEASPNVPLGEQSPSAEEFRLQRRGELQSEEERMRELIMQYLRQIGSPLVNPVSLPRA